MDIEKMSNIDISQDSVKSISEKCNQLKDLQKQIEDHEDKLKTLKNQSRDLYFTEAINHIIKNKIAKVGYLDVRKNFWTEIDDKNDLLLAKKNLNEKYN